MTLSLRALPALHGDALWLEYGKNNRKHVLIDGGPRSRRTGELIADLLEADPSAVELVIVTHIDADHITGVVEVFRDRTVALEPGDVWFNAWRHLPNDLLGAEQGEMLSGAIETRGIPWNVAFEGGPVSVPDKGPLRCVELASGLRLTILSPTRAELAALRPVWKREVEGAGLVPGVPQQQPPPSDLLGWSSLDLPELATRPFNGDPSEANGASIALLVEFEQKSVLLTGDAHADVLNSGLRRLASERGLERLPVDVVKLPHHGSRRNVSQELVNTIDCERWLFSTNGAIFGHPDPEAVARIVVDNPEMQLMFNYRTESTERFDSFTLRHSHKYRTVYPESDHGLQIDLPG